MSPVLRTFVFLLFIPSAIFAATIRGVVRDAGRQPVSGAIVTVDGAQVATTGADGSFVVRTAGRTHTLLVFRDGFRAESREVRGDATLEIELRPAIEEVIVVSGIRAAEETPVTKTNIGREEIERTYHQQDIPLLLRQAPSIHAWGESGTGNAGYSYITLRGISSNRLNFTLDGVPLGDSEDFGTYFVDFPDLAQSLESIQIQRGTGTSTVGTPAFGGSVNLESIRLSDVERTDARLSAGSFGSRHVTAGHQTGRLPGDVALYARASYSQTEGFRESSATRQRNLFASASKRLGDGELRLTGFTARERQQSSYFAADEATLRTNLRANPLQPEEKDSFGYDLAQLRYLTPLGPDTDLTASVYYQRGYGWFRLYDDRANRAGLREYGLDGLLTGALLTMNRRLGPLAIASGVHVNRFKREHTRDLIGGPRDYSNDGVKGEANAFAKVSYDRDAWHLFGDAQVRHATFRYRGSVAIEPVDWTFFNPKIGARYRFAPEASVYASVGMSRREPTRTDLFQGEDDASVPHDLRAVRPESVLDFEFGWDYRSNAWTFAANAYAMEFRNEIAATGELSEIGLTLRRNVARSYRRGIEIDAAWRLSDRLHLRTVANVNRSRIRSWTQFYDVYDAEGNYVTSRPMLHRDVVPLLTPRVMVSQSIDYAAGAFSAGVTARYAGKSYLDNTNHERLATPSFAAADVNVALDLSRWIASGRPRLSIQINNVFDNDRIRPSGYSYPFITAATNGTESLDGMAWYYPQATRHAVVMLDWRM